MEILGKVDVNHYGTRYKNVELYIAGTYQDGTTAIKARLPNGSPFAVLTVCVEGASLEKDEVLVKTWSENQNLAKACLESGLFTQTQKKFSTGYVFAEVWKLNKK